MPVIGITTYARDEENNFYLSAQYVSAIRRAGGLPMLIPPGEKAIDNIVEAIDGLLFSGGGDIDPSLYGGTQHEELYHVDKERDSSEMILCKRALRAKVPIFGICRGAQLINVVEGGSLYEHLPDVVGDSISHRDCDKEHVMHHIQVSKNSMLASIIEDSEFSVASKHHQAIRTLAPTLTAVAHAEDGIIEAIEMPEHNFLLAVQWHPELTAETEPNQQILFDTFVGKSILASHFRRAANQ